MPSLSTHSLVKNLCLWGCTLYFADRVILAAYRCIEEHNFDFKRPVGVLLPLLFAFRGVQQSTFPLFIDRFRLRCNSDILLLPLFMSEVPVASPVSCWRCCLHWAKRCAFCYAVSCCRLLFRCSCWISSRRSRSRGVSVVNRPRWGFAASCWIQRCCVCCSGSFAFTLFQVRWIKKIRQFQFPTHSFLRHPHNLNTRNRV